MGPKPQPARPVEVAGEGAAARSRAAQMPGSPEFSEAEPGLGDYLWTLVEHRTLIILAMLATLFLGVAYIMVAAPTFHSDVVLQVQDKTKSLAGLEDLSTMFTDTSPSDTEIEIIRSRSLVGTVVDELNLTIEAFPRAFPIIGGAFFRRHEGDEI